MNAFVKPLMTSSTGTLADKIAGASEAIKGLLLDGKHLVLAWSGGKDSNVMLTITLNAALDLMAEGLSFQTIHIVHSDTKLENPVLHAHNQYLIDRIRRFGGKHKIPARFWLATPSLSCDYLVSLIGGRTIASTGSKTKCQQMMKSYPLARTRKAIGKFIAKQLGRKPAHDEIVSLVGTRFDESVARGVAMTKRGESALVPVNTQADKGGEDWVMSPIAHFSTEDVFSFIGGVRAGRIPCYDSFDELVQLYRDMNGGDCMVTAYLAGKDAGRTACGARSGCWICLRVSKDTSAENMIVSQSHSWLKPLNDLRNLIMARHLNPSYRSWLGRKLDADGCVSISAVAYSPAFTRELLGMVLTIQRDEELAAANERRPTRFTLINTKQLIAIEMLWSRYAFHPAFEAFRVYKAVYEEGERFDIPRASDEPQFTNKEVSFTAKAPFADALFNSPVFGLRNVDHALADWERTTETRSGQTVSDVVTADDFSIDEEAAELFMDMDLDYALQRQSINDGPSASAHYLLSLGVVALYKGSHGDWDRMLRVSNQIHRLGLTKHLHDPKALMNQLGVSATAQLDLL